MARWGWVAAIAAIGFALPAQAEVSRAGIEAAIERGVKLIVSQQAQDGHWEYRAEGAGRVKFNEGPVGDTALAVLALQHSGSRNAEAALAIKKGMSWIVQQPPEAKTYSAGLAERVLYLDFATKHRETIGVYATMLCEGQKTVGRGKGSWGRRLPEAGEGNGLSSAWAMMGLRYAEKGGYEVPKEVWERARAYYEETQGKDGSWDYRGGTAPSRMAMTLAGTAATYECDGMLRNRAHEKCEAHPINKTHEAGLRWIKKNWEAGKMSPYDWYLCKELGDVTGYSGLGEHDWFQEGAAELIPQMAGEYEKDFGGRVANTAFSVLFLATNRHRPTIINKLRRDGGWDLHRHDIENVIEMLSGPWSIPCTWKVVTLEAKADFLLKAPILWISGHEALKFTAEEKAKLKEYVERGGTIVGEACCSKKAFDNSFRAMLKELWPDSDLADLPKTHPIYTSFRKMESPAQLMGMPLAAGQGRLGVIYIPNGISCKWEVGRAGGREALYLGACIYLYVDKTGKRLKAGAAEK